MVFLYYVQEEVSESQSSFRESVSMEVLWSKDQNVIRVNYSSDGTRKKEVGAKFRNYMKAFQK